MLSRFAGPFREFGFFAGMLYSIDRLCQTQCPSIRLYFYELMVQPIGGAPLLPARISRSTVSYVKSD